MSLAALMIAMTATVLTSCSNNVIDEIENSEVETPKPGNHVETLTIAFPNQEQTRVAIDGSYNITGWEEGDEVQLVQTDDIWPDPIMGYEEYIIIRGTYTFTCTDAANGTFTGTLPNGTSVNDCQLAFYNVDDIDVSTSFSKKLLFSPKTRASQKMKDVVMMVAKKNNEGNFEMKIFGSILQVTNNTGNDITASVKIRWNDEVNYYHCNGIMFGATDFEDFETYTYIPHINHPITLSKDAPTYVYIPVFELNAGNANYAVGVSAAGDVAHVCTIVPFKTNPANAKLFKVTYNGHEYVDLGLPSGLKWATMNVGAKAPEEAGLYFGWGDSEGYTSNTNDGRIFIMANDKWMTEGQTSFIYLRKYTLADDVTSALWYQDGEFVGDNKTVLDSEDDAAFVNWGGNWRMPTDAEWTELRENCTWTWTTQNGVNGYRVSGSNSNSIFLPAAGYRYNTGLDHAGVVGCYWSSSLTDNDSGYARQLVFESWYVKGEKRARYYGNSVRPVCQ